MRVRRSDRVAFEDVFAMRSIFANGVSSVRGQVFKFHFWLGESSVMPIEMSESDVQQKPCATPKMKFGNTLAE